MVFETKYNTHLIASDVLAVAVIQLNEKGEKGNFTIFDKANNFTIFDWAAYIGAVKSINLEADIKQVAENGSKLSIKMAELLFPGIDINKYRL